MELTEQEKQSINYTLKEFIYSIRKSDVCYKIYKYYTSDFSQRISKNRKNIELNFDSIETQSKRKILSDKIGDPYFDTIKISNIKLIEEYTSKHGLKEFKDYIEFLLKHSLSDFEKEQKQKEQEEKDKEDEFLINILNPKSDLLLIPVKNILKSQREYIYKNEKIKAFLDIQLNNTQIFNIMNNYENLKVTNSYIEKFRVERQALLVENKIQSFPQEVAIKKYLNVL